MKTVTPRLLAVRPGEGERIDLGGLGVDFKVWGKQTGGAIAVVEHPIAARRLVPTHMHTKEDELSYVLEGKIGARIGDEITEAVAGTYVFKPRNVQHTFWNPTDEPARLIEMIVPAGFDEYFAELGRFFSSGGAPGSPAHQAISTPYGLTLSSDWIDELKVRYELKMVGEP